MAPTHPPTPNPKPQPIPAALPVDYTQTQPGTDAGGNLDFAVAPPMFGSPVKPNEVGTLGRYRILKQLGQGGMGSVYLAFDPDLERKVAIKVMMPKYARDPKSRERFLREARTCAKVKSDHVVTIHQVGEIADTPFIAMEYLEGYPLDRYLTEKGTISLSHSIRIGRETALGLQAAHDQGLVHRDVKPSNLWLEAPKGRVKLIDFGLARLEEEDVQLTGSGAVIGTPAYMSPEQGRAEHVDHRSDLFSLGGVMYRLLTGEMPFKGATTMALLRSLELSEPTPIRSLNPQVPEALASLVHRLLDKDPAKRPQTAAEVAQQLANLTQMPNHSVPVVIKVEPLPISVQTENVWEDLEDFDEPGTASSQPSKPVEKPLTKKSRSRLPWILAGLLLLVGAVVAGIVMIPTAKGTLIIESDDPDVEVVVKKDGAVIREKTKDREIELKVGDYTIELVEKKDGLKLTTEKFSIVKNGKETVRVRLEKPKDIVQNKDPLPGNDPERTAAEWLLNQGKGTTVSVQIIGGDLLQGIAKSTDLPKQPFLTEGCVLWSTDLDQIDFSRVPPLKNLRGNQIRACPGSETALGKWLDLLPAELETFVYVHAETPCITKATIDRLKRFTELKHLGLENPGSVPAADMAPLATLKKLKVVELSHMQITDSGMVYLKDLPLTVLRFPRNAGDASVKLFANHSTMLAIDVHRSQVTRACITDIATMQNLTEVVFAALPWTAEDLAVLAKLPKLNTIRFEQPTKLPTSAYDVFLKLPKLETLVLQQCEDADIQKLAKVPTLLDLDIFEPKFTRAALETLGTMRQLRMLRIHGAGSGFKEADIRKLHDQIPTTKLIFGSVVLDPQSPDRNAADWVLSIGGSLRINEEGKERTMQEPLPNEKFQLTSIFLHGCDQVTDQDLARFVECKKITRLILGATKITDEGLKHCKGHTGLTYLFLGSTKTTDAGLENFKACKSLISLDLGFLPITDGGLELMKDCTELRTLDLMGTKITDASVPTIVKFTKLAKLDVRATAITKEKLEELRKGLPKCQIQHDGGVIQPQP